VGTNFYWSPGLSFRTGFSLRGGITQLDKKYSLLQRSLFNEPRQSIIEPLTDSTVWELKNQIEAWPWKRDSYKWPYRPQLHIGKSSHGWAFALHVIPQLRINDLPDWVELLDYGQITSEYGDTLTKEELLRVITERARPTNEALEIIRNERSNWVPGENGVYINHRLIGGYYQYSQQLKTDNLMYPCVGEKNHCRSIGAGTWYCTEGEFS